MKFSAFFYATGLCFAATAASAGELTIVSWGGAYTKSQTEAYYKPWMANTGHRILSEDYSGGLSEVKAQVEAGNVSWDVVDVEDAEAILGCDEGLFEEIDPAILPPAPDGTPAEEDFLEGTIEDCAIGTVVWSTAYAYNRERLSPPPTTIQDFFDLEKFPGRRGMRKTPKVNLEIALVADGVPPGQVYEVMATPEGIDRAFAKLDSIREHVLWWEVGAQPPQLLVDGEVIMSTAYNGRIFNALTAEGQPLAMVWDAQVLAMDNWVVVKGAPNLELALDFIRFASMPENMAVQASWISYAPVRKSASELVGNYHADPDLEMGPHLPTWPDNMKTAIWHDEEFWADHIDELNERFNAWLIK
ncbi:MAG: ABC transporter substrate-binding protein [Gammaproteobacteria bacterium]|nr:ABC transporter substrate-binding protein [Gammaproteobacteria bacterium]